MSEKKKPILSISILISNNRAKTINKCMKALVPLREAVPSELILVDTGCKDEGIEIARRYADKIVEFSWCNDFAAARNAGLTECTGEWFLFMDDDEWFDDVSELIAFFQSEERHRYDTLWYIVRNYDDFEGTTYGDTFVGRGVKLTPETKFYGKIHEWIEPFPVKVKRVSSYAHHYGYVYKSEEERQKHLARNITLEEMAVAERPEDIRMCCQLVQEYRAAERYEDAERLCVKTFRESKYKITYCFMQYLLLVLPKIYREQKQFEKSREEFERIEREETLLHQTKRALHYEKALLFGQMREPVKMQEACRRFFEECESFPKVGDPVEYEVMDFASYTSEGGRAKMLEYGLRGMLVGKTFENAEFFLKYIDWEKETPQRCEQLEALLELYRQSGNGELLKLYLPKIIAQKDLESTLYGSLHKLYDAYPESREKLLEDLELTGLCGGGFTYFHILYLVQQGKLVTEDVVEYYEKSDRKHDADVIALLFAEKELFPTVLAHSSMEQYAEAMLPLMRGKESAELERIWQIIPELAECYPEEKQGFLLYANMVIAEKRLMVKLEALSADKNKDDVSFDGQTGVRAVLYDYMDAAKQYAEAMYRPELLNAGYCGVLPANLRFVYAMGEAMAQEGDFFKWGEGIKKAAKEYPVLLPVVKALLQETEQKQALQGGAQQELIALAEQLKAVVRAQLAEGKREEAKVILSELAQMMPEDEEVKELIRVK